MKRYALVTGASRGIGRAIAIELAKDGCSILLNYKSNHAAAQEAKRLIEEVGGEAELMPFDVSQPDDINMALDKWFAAHQDDYIDVLVNNAGIVDDEIMLMMKPSMNHHLSKDPFSPQYSMKPIQSTMAEDTQRMEMIRETVLKLLLLSSSSSCCFSSSARRRSSV